MISVDGVYGDLHFRRSFSFFDPLSWSAQIAQLAEHVLGKDEVAGSNPVLGSRSTSHDFFDVKVEVTHLIQTFQTPWLKVHSNARNRTST